MEAATVVQVLKDLFYALLHALLYLWSRFTHRSSSNWWNLRRWLLADIAPSLSLFSSITGRLTADRRRPPPPAGSFSRRFELFVGWRWIRIYTSTTTETARELTIAHTGGYRQLFWEGHTRHETPKTTKRDPKALKGRCLGRGFTSLLAGVKAGCVHLCRVAGNTVWSRMASDVP